MSTISKYTIANAEGEDEIDSVYDTFDDAKGRADLKAAQTGEPWAVIELEFEYSDSMLVYATDGSDVWPPQ